MDGLKDGGLNAIVSRLFVLDLMKWNGLGWLAIYLLGGTTILRFCEHSGVFVCMYVCGFIIDRFESI